MRLLITGLSVILFGCATIEKFIPDYLEFYKGGEVDIKFGGKGAAGIGEKPEEEEEEEEKEDGEDGGTIQTDA